ncbi:5'-methylthioadenosine/S-adenosylhomocysteine nucleosidase, partial [Actinospica sp. MGRD01-02]
MNEPLPPANERSRAALQALIGLKTPVSGRRVARAMGVSPTTAAAALAELEATGLALSRREGRAVLWSANMDAPGVQTRAAALRVAAAFDRPAEPSAPDAARWQASASHAPRQKMTAVVLTAVDTEYDAVLEQLTDRHPGKLRSGRRWRRGSVHGEYVDWRVYLVQSGPGDVPAADLTTEAAHELLPHLMLFVGVGRGLKRADQRIGDIVVAEHVDTYDLGKDTVAADGTSKYVPGGDPVNAPRPLVELAREQARIWRQAGGPRVSFGQIVSGGKVAAGSADSQLEELLAGRFGRALALDMESYGFSKAASNQGVAALVVRSVSDFGLGKNPEDDAEHQPLAARSAARFALELLRQAEPDDVPLSHHARPPQTQPMPTAPD